MIRRISNFVRNVWEWREFLDRGGDWDSYYLLQAMVIQMTTMRKALNNEPYEGSDKDADTIQECIEGLRKLMNPENFPKDEECQCAGNKWMRMNTIPIEGSPNFECRFVETTASDPEAFRYVCEHNNLYGYYEAEKEARELFTKIADNYTKWWY